MTISVRDVLRTNGIITYNQCSLKKLVSHLGVSSTREALAKLKDNPGLPLEPDLGGRHIKMDDLRPGDIIIVSGAPPSTIKTIKEGDVISYAILYLGSDEAAGAPIEVIDPASAVCVVRSKDQPGEAELRKVIHIGARTYWGRVYQAAFRLDLTAWCVEQKEEQARAGCENYLKNWLGHVNLGTKRAEDGPGKGFFSFYLPKFVIDAYALLEKPIAHRTVWSSTPPLIGPAQPGALAIPPSEEVVDLKPDQVNIRLTGTLGYVGHLKWPN